MIPNKVNYFGPDPILTWEELDSYLENIKTIINNRLQSKKLTKCGFFTNKHEWIVEAYDWPHIVKKNPPRSGVNDFIWHGEVAIRYCNKCGTIDVRQNENGISWALLGTKSIIIIGSTTKEWRSMEQLL